MSVIHLSSGRKFQIPLYDPLVADHFKTKSSLTSEMLYQINDQQLYAKFFSGREKLTFLDLGANIGLVSIYASDACKRIAAVEPSLETHAVLKIMTRSLPQIEIVQAALAPKDGECDLFLNSLNTTSNSTVNMSRSKVRVRGVTLSSLLREQQLTHVDVCKVDIEGAEGDALSLSELEAVKNIIHSYYIEFHNCPKTTWEHKLGKAVSILGGLGYHRLGIIGTGLLARKP